MGSTLFQTVQLISSRDESRTLTLTLGQALFSCRTLCPLLLLLISGPRSLGSLECKIIGHKIINHKIPRSPV